MTGKFSFKACGVVSRLHRPQNPSALSVRFKAVKKKNKHKDETEKLVNKDVKRFTLMCCNVE